MWYVEMERVSSPSPGSRGMGGNMTDLGGLLTTERILCWDRVGLV